MTVRPVALAALATLAVLSTRCTIPDANRPTDIACGESRVALVGMPGRYQCQSFPPHPGSEGTGGLFQRFGFSGHLDDGDEVSLQALKAMNPRSYIIAGSINENAIRNLPDTMVRDGRGWSTLRTNSRGTKVTEFSSGGRNCFAFVYGGGAGEFGLTFSVRGAFCRPGGRPPFSDAEEEALLDRIVVRSS
jgi:hypothetical protein